MDGERFDRFTKGLGEQRSRRGVLKRVGATALGLAGIASVRKAAEAAPPPKVGVCHLTGNANMPYSYIMVSPSMATTLARRGDKINIDLSSDVDNCGSCGHTCWYETFPEAASPVCNDGTCGFVCNGGFYDDGNGNCVWDPPRRPLASGWNLNPATTAGCRWNIQQISKRAAMKTVAPQAAAAPATRVTSGQRRHIR